MKRFLTPLAAQGSMGRTGNSQRWITLFMSGHRPAPARLRQLCGRQECWRQRRQRRVCRAEYHNWGYHCDIFHIQRHFPYPTAGTSLTRRVDKDGAAFATGSPCSRALGRGRKNCARRAGSG
jgi:hypothetical protein